MCRAGGRSSTQTRPCRQRFLFGECKPPNNVLPRNEQHKREQTQYTIERRFTATMVTNQICRAKSHRDKERTQTLSLSHSPNLSRSRCRAFDAGGIMNILIRYATRFRCIPLVLSTEILSFGNDVNEGILSNHRIATHKASHLSESQLKYTMTKVLGWRASALAAKRSSTSVSKCTASHAAAHAQHSPQRKM